MSIKRHTLYNLSGSLAGLAISLVTVPLYIHHIGAARYGALAIVWLLLGYFGLFDLGMGRATAQAVATDGAQTDRLRQIVWSALAVNLVMGLLGGGVLWLVGDVLIAHLLHASVAMRAEIIQALPWVAAALPLATVSSVIQGALQGRSQFLLLNSLSVFGSALFQIIPLLIAIFVSVSLAWLIPAAVLARSVGALIMWILGGRVLRLGAPSLPRRAVILRLFKFGAWVTVTSIVGPILDGVDRLAIGAMVSAQAVAFYTVPYQLATKGQVLAGSLAGALFPRLASVNSSEAERLLIESIAGLSAILTPLICVAVVLIHPFLSLWISPQFAARASLPGQILLIGAWMNLQARIPLSYLLASGRPDLPAKFHLAELIPYLGALWLGIATGGVAGVAVAWTVRVGVDALLLAIAGGILASLVSRLLPSALLVGLMFAVARAGFPFLWLSVLVRSGVIVLAIIVAAATMPEVAKKNLRSLANPWLSTCVNKT